MRRHLPASAWYAVTVMRTRPLVFALAIPTVSVVLAEGCSSGNGGGSPPHVTTSSSGGGGMTGAGGTGGGGLGGSSSGMSSSSSGGGAGGSASSSSGGGSGGGATSSSSSGGAGCGFTTGDPVCDGCLTTSCCTQETACANDTTCTTCVTAATPPASCNSNALYNAFGDCFTNTCNTQCGGGSSTSSSSSSSSSTSSSSGTSTSSSTSASSATSSSTSASSTTSSTTSASSTTSSTTSSTSTSSSSSTSSSGGVCGIGHMVISQVRSRGAGGAADEFIELWNPTASPITLDNTWKIRDRSTSATIYTTRWTGTGTVIPAYGHYLITGTAYTESPAGDKAIIGGITDASNIILVQGTTNVDVLCYAYDTASQAILTDPTKGYTCAGTPADNTPHNNGTSGASNSDVSLVRKPGGSGGNCTDINVSSSDFAKETPAIPHSTASAATP